MNRNYSFSCSTFLLTIFTSILHVRKRGHVMIAFVRHALVTIAILVARFCQEVRSSVKDALENAQFKSGALFVYGYERNPFEDKGSSTELQLRTRDRLVTGQFIQKVLISSRNIIFMLQCDACPASPFKHLQFLDLHEITFLSFVRR